MLTSACFPPCFFTFYSNAGKHLICEGYWQVNSRTSIFHIADPNIGITATVKNATHVGKKLTDKARLLKITLNSEDD